MEQQQQREDDGAQQIGKQKGAYLMCDLEPAANQPAGVPSSRPGPAQAPTPAHAARSQLGPDAAVREMTEQQRQQQQHLNVMRTVMAGVQQARVAAAAASDRSGGWMFSS